MTPFARTRWRLAAWNLAVLGLVLVATTGATAFAEIRARDASLVRELRLGAEREVARFGAEDDEGSQVFDDETADIFAFWVDRRARVVRNSRQVALPGLPDTAGVAAALEGREMFSDIATTNGVPVRLLSVPVYHEGRINGAVQVGRVLSDTQAQLTQFLLILAGTGAAGLVLAGVGSVFLAGRAVRPIQLAFEQQRQFLADASHELRTPVAVVRARGQALGRFADRLPAEAQEDLRQLHRDTEELSDLLGELLDLARLDAGQAEIVLESVPLADVVDELVTQLRPLAQERGVTLTGSASPLWVRANLSATRQVLRALADNALKHTPAGGTVRIEAEADGGRARVAVVDTGQGIPSEHLPRVFDRFYRADPAGGRATQQTTGIGLGLAIAAELVRRMHGDMRLTSQPGAGTTATVHLPLAAPPPH